MRLAEETNYIDKNHERNKVNHASLKEQGYVCVDSKGEYVNTKCLLEEAVDRFYRKWEKK